MKFIILIIIFLSIYFLNCQLNYNIGEEYYYSVDFDVKSFGQKENGEVGQNSFAKVNAIFMMKCIKKDANTFTLQSNLYDTEIITGQKKNEKLIDQSTKQIHKGKLGSDITFIQKKDGQILNFHFDSSDDITFNEVKISCINQLQTTLSSNRDGNVKEEDVNGIHYSTISAQVDNDIIKIKKTFNEKDFISFSDKNVKKENVKINSVGEVSLKNGNVINSNTQHQAILKGESSNSKSRSDSNNDLDFTMASNGNIKMKLIKIVKGKNMRNEEENLKNLKKSTFYEIGKEFVEFTKKRNDMEKDKIEKLFNEVLNSKNDLKKDHYKLNQIIDILNSNNGIDKEKLFENQFEILTKQSIEKKTNKNFLEKLNYITINTGMKKYLIDFIKNDKINQEDKIGGILTLSNILKKSNKILREEDYPFYKEFNTTRTWGSKDKIAATLSGKLFVGTNFDCKHDSLNYKALAQVDADVSLFGITKNAFEAKFVYARKNGATAEDDIHLSVFNKVIYQKYIGKYLDCLGKKYDIYHTQKLFSVQYTLFVFYIPITFKAGASIKIAVDWDWKVCPADLFGQIEIVPGASLIVYGNAEINLLIAKAGVELDGSFDIKLIPQGYVHGSKCLVGFDVLLRTDPMNIDLFGYVAVKSCKSWFFFNCSWKEIKRFNIFKWSLPAKEEILFKKEFPIIKP